MFEEVKRGFSFWSWIFQLVLAYCGAVAILAIQYRWLNVQDRVLSQVLSFMFVAVTEFGMALLTSAVASDSAPEGSLIWIVPAGFEIVGIVLKIVSPYGWVAVLFALPTWGYCWYSATMWWRLSKLRRAASLRPS
jgi:hypothetical protein